MKEYKIEIPEGYKARIEGNKVIIEQKESEDERIKNLLYCLIRDRSDNGKLLEHNGVSVDMALAWIEKQGEQKTMQEFEPTPIFRKPTPIFRIGDILKRKGKEYTFRVDRIQGGYYHSYRNHGAFFPIEEQDNWELEDYAKRQTISK